MFSKSKSKPLPGRSAASPQRPAAPSLISDDLTIQGDLDGRGDVQIDGTVNGDIRCNSLLVGESATIKGEIVADTVRVHGTVNGQIQARTVSLARTAHVVGNILHESLSVEQGAFLEGHCKRLESKKEGIDTPLAMVAKDGAARSDAKAAPAAGEAKKMATSS